MNNLYTTFLSSRTVIERNETLYCSPVSVRNRTRAGEVACYDDVVVLGNGKREISAIFTPRPDERSLCPE